MSVRQSTEHYNGLSPVGCRLISLSSYWSSRQTRRPPVAGWIWPASIRTWRIFPEFIFSPSAHPAPVTSTSEKPSHEREFGEHCEGKSLAPRRWFCTGWRHGNSWQNEILHLSTAEGEAARLMRGPDAQPICCNKVATCLHPAGRPELKHIKAWIHQLQRCYAPLLIYHKHFLLSIKTENIAR